MRLLYFLPLLIPLAQGQSDEAQVVRVNLSGGSPKGPVHPVPPFAIPTKSHAPGACVNGLCHPLSHCVTSPGNPGGLCVNDPNGLECYGLGCEFD